MLSKTALALIIAGTAVAQQTIVPVLPRWISADNHGKGYIFMKYHDGTFLTRSEFTVSWDFDYNCMRLASFDYIYNEQDEIVFCNNVRTKYSSKFGCRT